MKEYLGGERLRREDIKACFFRRLYRRVAESSGNGRYVVAVIYAYECRDGTRCPVGTDWRAFLYVDWDGEVALLHDRHEPPHGAVHVELLSVSVGEVKRLRKICRLQEYGSECVRGREQSLARLEKLLGPGRPGRCEEEEEDRVSVTPLMCNTVEYSWDDSRQKQVFVELANLCTRAYIKKVLRRPPVSPLEIDGYPRTLEVDGVYSTGRGGAFACFFLANALNEKLRRELGAECRYYILASASGRRCVFCTQSRRAITMLNGIAFQEGVGDILEYFDRFEG